MVVAVIVVGVILAAASALAQWPKSVRPVNVHQMVVGVNHTQHTIEPWHDPQSRARAMRILSEVAPVQNQFIMGWGALNPNPAPGRFNWSTLDQRMKLISDTGGFP